MIYKGELIKAMKMLAKEKNTIFLGYNVRYGPQMNGTLTFLPPSRRVEMPVAENLIMGVAMGLSLTGYKPIVCFERMDFMMTAMDAIMNHLDKLPKLSGYQFSFPVIIRACVGYNEPLDPGIQHMCDYSDLFFQYADFPVVLLEDTKSIVPQYKMALESNRPVMLIEYKRRYDDRGD